MLCRNDSLPLFVRRFVAEELGVATVDWVIITSAATAAGIMALSLGQDGLGQYSSDVRDEVQAPYFQTSWTQDLEIPPEELWDTGDTITPVSDGSGNGDGTTGNSDGDNGGGNGSGDGDSGDTDDDSGDTDDDSGDTDDDDGDTDDDSGDTDDDNGDTDDGDPDNGNADNTGGTTTPVSTPVTLQSDIVVFNPGFETRFHRDGQWSSGVPGWTANAGRFADVGDFNPTRWSIDESTVTGNNVAFLYHGGGSNSASMWQTVPEIYSASGTYEFSVDIGDGSYSFSDDQPYILNIYAVSTIIGTLSGSTGDIDALETVTVTSTLNDPSLNGRPISFEIVHPAGSGGDLLVDNVRGTVTTTVAPVEVVNGDFDSGNFDGWTLDNGPGEIVAYNGALGFNARNSAFGGTASQTVTVTPGASYVLTADLFENGWRAGSHTVEVKVLSATGQTLSEVTVTVLDGQALPIEVPFTSPTEQVTLQFSNPWSSASLGTDVMLDNVAVSVR
jgi:hypothetical protein